MLIPLRCYAVVAGTGAGDPLGRELVCSTDRAAAALVAAALQAQARRGVLIDGAQYYVVETDEELDLPVASVAEAVALGYTVRATVGEAALLVGQSAPAPGRSAAARRTGPPLVRPPARETGSDDGADDETDDLPDPAPATTPPAEPPRTPGGGRGGAP